MAASAHIPLASLVPPASAAPSASFAPTLQRTAPSMRRKPSTDAPVVEAEHKTIVATEIATFTVAAPHANAQPTREDTQDAPSDKSSQIARSAPAVVPGESAKPAYLYAPEPEFPESAREEGEEGLVVLRVLVSDTGRPAVVRLSMTSGSRALDAAAVAAVKRWTFVAARHAGRDVEAWMDIPIRFRLR